MEVQFRTPFLVKFKLPQLSLPLLHPPVN